MEKRSVKYEMNVSAGMVSDGTSTAEYGVTCYENGTAAGRFEALSTDRAAVLKLVDLCNSGDLAPEHLRDVVEDFLTEQS